MFWRITATVRREWAISHGTFDRSSDIRATSAVSMAASLPAAPIAIPSVASAMAGASLTPSPTMATVPYRATSSSIAATLSAGSSSARTSSTPACWPTLSAVPRLSPVSITMRSTPSARSAASVPGDAGRSVSTSASKPHTCVSSPTTTTVLPVAASASSRRCTTSVSCPRSSSRRWEPSQYERPSRRPLAPLPCTIWKSSAARTATSRAFPYARIAAASGCSLRASSDIAISSSSRSSCPFIGTTSKTRGRPSVSVPVLSSATALR